MRSDSKCSATVATAVPCYRLVHGDSRPPRTAVRELAVASRFERMSQITDDDVFVRAPSALWREVLDGVVVLGPDARKPRLITGPASRSVVARRVSRWPSVMSWPHGRWRITRRPRSCARDLQPVFRASAPRRRRRTRHMNAVDLRRAGGASCGRDVRPRRRRWTSRILDDAQWQQLATAVRARTARTPARTIGCRWRERRPPRGRSNRVGHCTHDRWPRRFSSTENCSRWRRSSIGARVDFLVLKGAAAAHLDRADPSDRAYGDVDLLVAAPHIDTAERLLADAGGRARLPAASSRLRSSLRQGLVVPHAGRARGRPSSHPRVGSVRFGHRAANVVRRPREVRDRRARRCMRSIGLDGSCTPAFTPCSGAPAPRLVPLLDVVHTAPADADESATVVELAAPVASRRGGARGVGDAVVDAFGWQLPAELTRMGAELRRDRPAAPMVAGVRGRGPFIGRPDVECRRGHRRMARSGRLPGGRGVAGELVAPQAARRLARGGRTMVRSLKD